MKSFKGYEVRDAIDHTIRRARSLFRPGNDRWNPIRWFGNGAYTDGTVITLPNFLDDAVIPHDEFRRLQAFALHELGHVIFSKFGPQYFFTDAFLSRMHNAVEDIWMEGEIVKSNLIPGSGELFHELGEHCMSSSPVDWTNPHNIAFALVCFGRGLHSDWSPRLNPIFAAAMPMIEASTGSGDNMVIAKWIVDQLRLPPPEDSPAPSNGAPSSGDPSNGDPSNDLGPIPADFDKNDGGVPIEPQFETSAGTLPSARREKVIKESAFINESRNNFVDTNVSGRLRFDVRKLFEKTDHYGWEAGYRSGTINSNRLAVYQTSGNVFKRRYDDEGIDSAVVLLVDLSSSMESTISPLVSAVYAVGASLAAANVPTAVVAFAGNASILKTFNEPWKRFVPKLRKLEPCGSTYDYDALCFAQKLLRSRSESRRVVFAFTDGEGHSPASVTAQVKSGERLGIPTIGVGIGYDVQAIYGPNSVRVDKISDLATVALNQIKLAA